MSQIADHEQAPKHLTRVTTLFVEGSTNFQLLFGSADLVRVEARRPGYTRATHLFVPGSRFGLDQWRRNAYGTMEWRTFICETVFPSEDGSQVPQVTPAVRVLMHSKGAAESRLCLAWIRQLQEGGVHLIECPRETFEAAHFRLKGARADRTSPERLSGRI